LTNIRKAELKDVPALFGLISQYAARQLVLPRTPGELYENIWEFTVAEEEGRVIGCGALRIYSEEIAEIRSLCVAADQQKTGIGSALTKSLLAEAERLRLKTVFALTVATGFFTKFGFREVPRDTLPMKVWSDCVHCEKYFCCDEKTMVLDVGQRAGADLECRREASEVPA